MGSRREIDRSEVGNRELEEEQGKEVIDRETTSFVNAQNIVKDSEEQRRESGEKDE
jgi:hypothetical protein